MSDENVVQLHSEEPKAEVKPDGWDKAATAPISIEDQIKALEEQIDQLEHKRMKSVVEELDFEPAKLAVIASDRAEERYKRSWKEMQKLIKQCAWSGLRKVEVDSVIPTINETIVAELIKHKFKAKVITVGGVQKIEVRW